MRFIKTKMPQHVEAAKSFAERILFVIINNRPGSRTNLLIVTDDYDRLRGYTNSCGGMVYYHSLSYQTNG